MNRVFIFSFFSSIIFTWLAIKIAHKLKIYDYPSSRKVHNDPTPLLGGVAIFFSYSLALLLNFSFSWELKGVVVASFFILLSGLIDDIKELSAYARLVIQILCSVVVISFGVRLDILPDAFPMAYFLESVITVVWIVGITNAMNFMDGMDGLAAGISVIVAGTFFCIARQTGQGYFAYLNAALIGSCLGFLIFNFKNAKIFLGDAGSSFLGFSLASLAVMGEWSHRPVVAFSIPILVLSILIFDMVYISAARILQGKVRTFKEWVEYVGKDHLHHRMTGMGFTPTQSVLLIYLINIVFSLGVLALRNAAMSQVVLLITQGVCILILVSVLMIAGRNNTGRSPVTCNDK